MLRGFRSIPLVFGCALPLAVAAQQPDHTDRDPEVVTIDVEDLRAELQKILDEDSIPGASVALVERDRTIWAGGVGKADVAAGVDVTADHLFRIGSISKSFTALAVRSIPAEPLRFAPFCVAFRSKYTRASSPGGGSSLTRLVSRAPRPHRENWPGSALTRVSPRAAKAEIKH